MRLGFFYSKFKSTYQHGFTLMELVITVIVLGAIATLVLPRFTLSMERNKVAEAISILSALRQAQVVYKFETNNYTNAPANLDVEIPASPHYNGIILDTTDPLDLIATINRSQVNQDTYEYTMGIDINGNLCCTSAKPANICTLLSYTTACP